MKDRFQTQREKDYAVLQSLIKREEPAVLEWKTHSPFVGCFWQWSYAYVNEGLVAPIVTTAQDNAISSGTIGDIVSLLGEPQHLPFDEFTAYNIDDDLWKDIPDGFLPNVWRFLHWQDIPFTWNCDGCGLTTNEPMGMSGFTGNGGVGIEVTGWYCDECHGSIQCSSCSVLNDPESPWWGHDDELIRLYNDGLCPQCEEKR